MAEKKTTTKAPTKKTTKKKAVANDHKLLAAISYIGVFFMLPLFMEPKNEYVQFHVKQGMVLFGLELIALALLITLIFSALTPILLLIAFLFSGYGFIAALNGQKAKIPGAEWVIKHLNI